MLFHAKVYIERKNKSHFMWWVNLIVYSDKKVVLEIDLERGEYALPSFSIDDKSKKNIIKGIKNSLGIDIEEFTPIKTEENSLFILVGEWEGKLKPKLPSRRVIWHKINDAISKIEDITSKESLTFFKKKYREIVLPSDKTVGIADIDECEKYKLTTRTAKIFIKNEKGEVMVNKNGNTYVSLLAYPELGESPEEAAYRHLRENFGVIAELRKVDMLKEYTKNKRVNSHILTGIYDESLTFFAEKANKGHFIALDKGYTPQEEKENVLSEELKSSLKALEGKI